MIDRQRIESLMKHLDMKQSAFGKAIGLTQSKMSKVLNGQQSLPEEALALIFEKYKVHPNWLFGYDGNPNEPYFLTDMVPKKLYQEVEHEKLLLASELKEVYKQLAEERGQIIKKQEANIETLKNIDMVSTGSKST